MLPVLAPVLRSSSRQLLVLNSRQAARQPPCLRLGARCRQLPQALSPQGLFARAHADTAGQAKASGSGSAQSDADDSQGAGSSSGSSGSSGAGAGGSKSGGGPASLERKNYYDILEVSRRAKPEEVKEAYRKLAKRYHPDRNLDDPDAAERFKEVQEAHATLSDTWKRALYDQDLQFGQYGSAATQDIDKENWTAHWAHETPEQREVRRERYRRYAAGERNDLPPEPYPLRWTPVLMVGTVSSIFYVCVQAPDWFDRQSDPTFNDPAFDDKTVPLVRAFHDPVLNRWERLPEGAEAPSPRELYSYYMKKRPDIMEEIDFKLLPKASLTVLSVPRTEAVKATFRAVAAHPAAAPAAA